MAQRIFKRSIALSLVAGMVLAAGVSAQSRASRVEAYLQSFHDSRRFNGAALIVDDGRLLFEGAFGLADLQDSLANSVSTRFRIASVTKQFTAALVLRLEEEGLLQVGDPVGRYIDEYPRPNGDLVTIHHLLTHTSGLPSYTNIPGFMESETGTPLSPGEIVALTWEEDLAFEPGSDFEYSNSGYVLLGWIAERVTGTSYEEALHRWVLAPAGLGNTGYDHATAAQELHASGYTRTLTGYEDARWIDPSLPYSAGMLYSTVGDLARWGGALFGWGEAALPFDDPATLERMITPALDSYAYGVAVRTRQIGDEESVQVVEHSGGIFGFSSMLRVFPDRRRLIVLLDNTSSGLGPIVDGLTQILWGLAPPKPKASIAERLLPIVESAGAEAAMSRYANWRRTRPDEYDYSPGQVLMMAGHFRDTDPGTAIQLLDAFVEETPEAGNVRFALSQLYEEAGDSASAAAQIESALTYMPGVPQLLARLAALGVEPDPSLQRPVVTVDPDRLALLAGEYRITPDSSLTVTFEDGFLKAGRTGEPAFRLLPQSRTDFLLRGSRILLRFADPEDGVPASVSVFVEGRPVTFPRVANEMNGGTPSDT